MSLEWTPFGQGEQFSLCIVGFSLLIFCWESSCLYSSNILALIFFFLVVALLIFGIRVMWLHRMPFRVFYPLQLFGSLRRTGISSLWVWVKLTCEAIWSGIFVCRKFTNYKLYFESSDWSVLIIYMILLDLIVWAEVFQNLACFF